MQLYTSLVRLKQAMNGGQLPPMTPVTGDALQIIDPAFTIGLGALEEDPVRGLRCPVRRCGRYFQNLSIHLGRHHKALGGGAAIKRALSIPKRTPLLTASSLEKYRSNVGRLEGRRRASPEFIARSRSPRNRERITAGERNYENQCRAQLSHKIIDLHHEIRRTPCLHEFRTVYGMEAGSAVITTFGTWNNALAQCGLDANKASPRTRTERNLEAVLTALSAWHGEHGHLPSANDTRYSRRTPLIPHLRLILDVMKTESWPEAMRRVASLLNIYGGRYGLPERKAQETAAD